MVARAVDRSPPREVRQDAVASPEQVREAQSPQEAAEPIVEPIAEPQEIEPQKRPNTARRLEVAHDPQTDLLRHRLQSEGGDRTAVRRTSTTSSRAQLAENDQPITAPASETNAPATSDVGDGELRPLTEDELRGVGSANLNPPQALWNENSVNFLREKGVAQNGLSQERADLNAKLAEQMFAAGAESGAQLTAGDVAAALRASGVAVEKQDPMQLDAATKYIRGGATPAEQQDRLRKSLDNFSILDSIGTPKMTKAEIKDQLWVAARVPGHAIDKMNDRELAQTYQQVAGNINSGAGKSELKIGSHTLKMTVDDQGRVTDSSTKKPGFLAALAKVGKIALTVASFVPSPIMIAARVASAAISAYEAAKKGSVMGAISAVASGVGAGVAGWGSKIFGMAADTASTVARVANGVSSTLRGIQQARQGGVAGILGGIAGAGAGIAGAIGDGAQGLSRTLGETSRRLGNVASGLGAVQAHRAAGRAVDDARSALDAARSSGDADRIRAAEANLQLAERNRRSAVLGGIGTAAAIAGDNVRLPGFADPPGGRSNVQRGLDIASRAFNGARDVNDRNYLGAGANALGAVAAYRDNNPREIIVRRNADGTTSTVERFDPISQASRIADGADGAYRASRFAASARAATSDAQNALNAARRSGDPAAIAAAEEQLRRARSNEADAQLNRYFALDAAAQAAQGALQSFRDTRANDRQVRQQHREAADLLKGLATEERRALEHLAEDPHAQGGFRRLIDEATAAIDEKSAALDEAIKGGDRAQIQLAAEELELARNNARDRAELLRRAFQPAETLPPQLITTLDLPRGETPAVPAAGAPAIPTHPYTIKSKDTLEGIARAHFLTVDDLRRANPGIDERRLQIGASLNLPDFSENPGAADNLQRFALHGRNSAHENYTVQAGDSVQSLARMYGISERDLRALNPQLAPDGRLFRGQKLNVPRVDLPDPSVMNSHAANSSYNWVNGSAFDGNIQSVVRQGQIGDCYFLASLASVAHFRPELIRNAITDNRDGTYTVRFQDPGTFGSRPREITVDGQLPQQSGANIYGSGARAGELWAPILEKAFAQSRGGYQAIGTGGPPDVSLAALTGQQYRASSTTALSRDTLWTRLTENVADRQPMAAATYNDPARYNGTNVVSNHAYAILNAYEQNGRRFVTLRNPWGNTSPGGGDFALDYDTFRNLYALVYTPGNWVTPPR